jgi:hypothetical protein
MKKVHNSVVLQFEIKLPHIDVYASHRRIRHYYTYLPKETFVIITRRANTLHCTNSSLQKECTLSTYQASKNEILQLRCLAEAQTNISKKELELRDISGLHLFYCELRRVIFATSPDKMSPKQSS